MKTIWHWKEIMKAAGVMVTGCVIAVVLTRILHLGEVGAFLVGTGIGLVSALLSMTIWDLYDFA